MNGRDIISWRIFRKFYRNQDANCRWRRNCISFYKNIMSDNKQNPGAQDRARINLNEEYEVRDWSKKFGVNPDELRKAVKEAGSMATDVEAYLKKQRTGK